jgi:hypothetical protein
MFLKSFRILSLPTAALTTLCFLFSPSLHAQQSSSSSSAPDTTAPAKSAPHSPTPQSQPDDAIPVAPNTEPMPPVPPNAHVIISAPTTPAAQSQPPAAPVAVDRDNLTFTAWDLELLIRPVASSFAARARVTIRNDASAPRSILPLEISSTLHWQAVSLNGVKLPFEVQSLDTDLDHTAAASEAVIHLPQPLAPGQSVTVDALYEGTIPLDASRLEHLGAPRDVAQRADWDRIAGNFTGVRGLGNVLWYPITAAPVTLGDGARLFNEVGQWQLRESAATMRIRLRVDVTGALDEPPASADTTPPDAAPHQPVVHPRSTPTTALLNGQRIALKPDTISSPDGDPPSLLTAELPVTPIGFAVPTIFLLSQDAQSAPGLILLPRAENAGAAAGYSTAANLVRPLIEQWLGHQQRDAVVADTPGPQDAPFETQAWWQSPLGGPLLFTPMLPVAPEQSAAVLAHTLAHACFISPRPWLAEGVPEFISTLWAGRNGDTTSALELLESNRPALALAEPGSPAAGEGQPLTAAYSEIYYRIKAAYVFWMLRDAIGDSALIHGLQSYHAADDTDPQYFQHQLEAASHKDLNWLFDDWVYHDRGLPDLHIANVVAHKLDTVSLSWLVSIDVSNDGYAAAEVPVSVSTVDRTESVRLLVPGRGRSTAHIVVHTAPNLVTVNNGSTPEVSSTIHQYNLLPQ